MAKAPMIIRKSNFWANLFKKPSDKLDLEKVILSMPPFRSLDKKHVKELLKIIHNRVYAPNEYIFYQGDPGLCMYIISEGEVQISQTDEDGNELDLVKFERGDFFGELALIDNERRSASAISVKESHVSLLFKPDLDEFLERFPKKGVQIMQGMSHMISMRLKVVNRDYLNCYRQLLILEMEKKNE